jgi:hypothetical protein
MLNAKERRTRLEGLFDRVQKKRTRLTGERLDAGKTSPEAASLQETVSTRRPEKSETVAEELPLREEVRQFATTPTTSGAVAVTKGRTEKEWTLFSVLEHAWKLGSPE